VCIKLWYLLAHLGRLYDLEGNEVGDSTRTTPLQQYSRIESQPRGVCSRDDEPRDLDLLKCAFTYGLPIESNSHPCFFYALGPSTKRVGYVAVRIYLQGPDRICDLEARLQDYTKSKSSKGNE
jgi:hypothetical protein